MILAPVSHMLTLRRTFVFVVFVGIFVFSARTATDPDLWWHLSTGRLIVNTDNVPHTDPFSYSRRGQPWVAHEWLADVWIYSAYRATGWTGLILLFAAITTAGFLLLYLRCVGRPYLAVAVTLLGVFACAPIMGVRPQMLSFMLTSLLLFVLCRSAARSRWVWCIPLIFAVWVNVHAAYAAGIAILVIFVIASLASHTGNTSKLLLVLVASIGTLALNPNGARMYSYPFEVLQATSMQAQIAEWFSPNFHQVAYLPLMLLILLMVLGLALSPRKPCQRDLTLLLGTLAAKLVSVRHTPLFVLIAVPVVCQSIEELLPFRFRSEVTTHQNPNGLRVTGHALLACVTLLVASVVITKVVARQKILELRDFPVRAVTFLRSGSSPPNIFDFYDWGGYVIWNLYPEHRVFIDGRADVYGDVILRQFADAYTLRHDWRRGLEEACLILVPSTSALATGLTHDPQWPIVYADEQATVFRRQGASTERVCEPLGTASDLKISRTTTHQKRLESSVARKTPNTDLRPKSLGANVRHIAGIFAGLTI